MTIRVGLSALVVTIAAATALLLVVRTPLLPIPGIPPPVYVLWSNGMDGPPTLVPERFARDAVGIVSCESGGDSEVVGPAGELGRLQIHPIHFPGMKRLRLDPAYEPDRVRYAVLLWTAQGWEPWSCNSALKENR